MGKISEINESEWERISSHSHISGLGDNMGLIGQKKARDAAKVIVDLVKEKKFGGRSMLIAGPPGSGKTAVALAISKELGKDVPFVPITGSEVFSSEIKKTEFLKQSLRKAIGVKITEVREIYEGEVDKVEINQEKNPMNPYQPVITAKVTLKTKNEKKTLSMDTSFAQQLSQQNVGKGDIIQIDPENGKLVKIGSTSNDDFDLKSGEIMQTPKGKIFKEKPFEYTLSLHQMDLVNAKSGGGIMSMFFGGAGAEIDNELRSRIDEQVKSMVESGKAQIIPGVLFIDECSLLDIESYSYLNRALEGELSPIIVFATNRGMTEIRGTTFKSPHGMPVDLLDRLLIITTEQYEKDEIKKILKIRAERENTEITKGAIEKLTEIGVKSSMRYAMQLMAPAKVIAKGKITEEHIDKVRDMFTDVKNSVKYLEKFESKMMK